MRDPRFVAIALALLAASIGVVGALATRPVVPPELSGPVGRAIAPIIRIVKPPAKESRSWTSTTTATTGPWRSGRGSGSTTTRTVTTGPPRTEVRHRDSPFLTPTTTVAREHPVTPQSTTTTTSSPTTTLPTTLPDLTTSTLVTETTTAEGAP